MDKKIISRKGDPDVNKTTEAEEQADLFEWVSWHVGKRPELQLLHAIPNGGSRHPAEARNLKRQGVKPGVSDLFLPVARRDFHGLYIEMKITGGKVQAAQKEWIKLVIEQGYHAVVAYGFHDAVEVIEWYLGMK